MVVREAKNGRSRLAPVGEVAAAAVHAWLEARPHIWTERAGEALWVGLTGIRLPSSCCVEEIGRGSEALGFRVTSRSRVRDASPPGRRARAGRSGASGPCRAAATQRYTRVTLSDLRGDAQASSSAPDRLSVAPAPLQSVPMITERTDPSGLRSAHLNVEGRA